MPADNRAVADHRDDVVVALVESRATAMPRPAEIEVEECGAANGSYSLSARLVKPESRRPCARYECVAPSG